MYAYSIYCVNGTKWLLMVSMEMQLIKRGKINERQYIKVFFDPHDFSKFNRFHKVSLDVLICDSVHIAVHVFVPIHYTMKVLKLIYYFFEQITAFSEENREIVNSQLFFTFSNIHKMWFKWFQSAMQLFNRWLLLVCEPAVEIKVTEWSCRKLHPLSTLKNMIEVQNS